ncbi:ankyrin repeat-containing domain protein [Tirmania nivea]|nr:ankyrin repeat-containing domain protein [Tirmania nivea]
MSVSFGFGVGDVLAVGTLILKVYNAYEDAPEQFRNFSKEIRSLHVVVEKIEQQLCTPRPNRDQTSDARPESSGNSTLCLSAKDAEDLKMLYDGLQAIVTELDALLTKYQSLASNPKISFDRLKWGKEDLEGLRGRIHTNISLLTAFNASLANCQLATQNTQLLQQEAQLVGIQEQLGQLLATTGLRRRGSVASLHSIASFAVSIGQKEAWKELCRELHHNGVTAEMLKAKKKEIFKLCRSTSTLGIGGRSNDDVVQGSDTKYEGKQAKKDRVPLDDIMQILLLPATQARYFVAGLGVRRMLSKGISIDAENSYGETALHVAAAKGHIGRVKVLIEKGATIDAITKNDWTALHVASRNGHIEVMKVLLDRGANIDATDKDNWTALHLAAESSHMEVVIMLLDRGATIHATDKDNWTALHLAVLNGHVEVVKVLLNRGATIDARDKDNWTALHLAAQNGHMEVVKVLLDRSATH